MKLSIASSDRDHAILVCDEDHNDIAEFFHNEHATVGQSYETALMLARKLVEPSTGQQDEREAIALDSAGRRALLALAKRHDEALSELGKAKDDKTRNWLGGRVNGLAMALEIARIALLSRSPAPGNGAAMREATIALDEIIQRTVNPAPTNMSDRRVLDWVNGKARALYTTLSAALAAVEQAPGDGVDRAAAALVALRAFVDAMERYGMWDDGCFYYNGRSASELQKPIGDARALMERSR